MKVPEALKSAATRSANNKPHGREFICFGPGPERTKDGEIIVGNWIVRGSMLIPKDSPLAKRPLQPNRSKLPIYSASHNQKSMSKLQAIKPITEKETASAALGNDRLSDVECNPMKTAPTNSSFADLIKDPAFRWTLLYILLAVLIYCLWPRGEYVSMGNGLILNKRTGEVHRACDRIKK